jgi:hypothetical protein
VISRCSASSIMCTGGLYRCVNGAGLPEGWLAAALIVDPGRPGGYSVEATAAAIHTAAIADAAAFW